jgi:hypothetical protein
MSARADLCGGRSAMIVPTATSSMITGTRLLPRCAFVRSNPLRSDQALGSMSSLTCPL